MIMAVTDNGNSNNSDSGNGNSSDNCKENGNDIGNNNESDSGNGNGSDNCHDNGNGSHNGGDSGSGNDIDNFMITIMTKFLRLLKTGQVKWCPKEQNFREAKFSPTWDRDAINKVSIFFSDSMNTAVWAFAMLVIALSIFARPTLAIKLDSKHSITLNEGFLGAFLNN